MEGNRRSGIALVVCCKLSGLSPMGLRQTRVITDRDSEPIALCGPLMWSGGR